MQADPTIGLIILSLVPAPFLLPFVFFGAGLAFGLS